MPPSPIPAPLPPWARWLLQVAPYISLALQEALQYIGTMEPSTATDADTWRHIQLSAQPAGNTDPAEVFITTIDVVNITNGSIDNTWTPGDYTTVFNILGDLMNGYAAYMQTGYVWKELRSYRRAFNPLSNPEPFTRSGPPEMVQAFGAGGTATSRQARQVAVTTTERTTYPRHWGRNYWPVPGSQTITETGLFGAAEVTGLANLVHDQYQRLMQAEFFPVVPVTQVQNVPTRGLLGVTAVQVDDIPDVIRRRRPRKGITKVSLPL